MAKRGTGKVAGVIVAEYEGLTVSVLPQPAKRTGKIVCGFRSDRTVKSNAGA